MAQDNTNNIDSWLNPNANDKEYQESARRERLAREMNTQQELQPAQQQESDVPSQNDGVYRLGRDESQPVVLEHVSPAEHDNGKKPEAAEIAYQNDIGNKHDALFTPAAAQHPLSGCSSHGTPCAVGGDRQITASHDHDINVPGKQRETYAVNAGFGGADLSNLQPAAGTGRGAGKSTSVAM